MVETDPPGSVHPEAQIQPISVRDRTRPNAGLSTTVDTVQGALTRRHTPGSAEWHLDEADHAAAVQEYAVRSIPTPRRSPENGPRSA